MKTVERPVDLEDVSSSPYKLRRFREDDLERVMTINRLCLPENYTPTFFLDLYNSHPETFLIAEYGGDVVGYVMCRIESGFSEFGRFKFVKKGHLVSIAVIEEHRDKNLGSRLLSAVMRGMAQYGCRESFLEVRKTNTQAIALYRKHGYEIARCAKGYYMDGEDACIMTTKLSPLANNKPNAN